jgi:hypothetical protein
MRGFSILIAMLALPACSRPPQEAEAPVPRAETPARLGSGQAAATTVATYYALVESGKTAEAAKLRADGVAEDLTPYRTLHADVGAPGPVEGAAGSLYVAVPVLVYGTLDRGGEYRRAGTVTLRRRNVGLDGPAEQLNWRIQRITLE